MRPASRDVFNRALIERRRQLEASATMGQLTTMTVAKDEYTAWVKDFGEPRACGLTLLKERQKSPHSITA